jgi:hypothetical protein
MSEHTLAVVCLLLLVANEGAGLLEEDMRWTTRKVVIGIPFTVFAWWLVLTVLL